MNDRGSCLSRKNLLYHMGFILSLGCLMWSFQGLAGGASTIETPAASQATQESTEPLIREAAQAVDLAWEEFHRAAIGGTLASPAVQSRIEQQLHEVRKLLMEARHAERDHRLEAVKTTTRQIMKITQFIIVKSQERKL